MVLTHLSHMANTLTHSTATGAFWPLLLAQLAFSSATVANTTNAPLTNDVIRPSCLSGLLTEHAIIERVTDGDTVVLADQRRVRLIGINAAELHAQSPQLKNAASKATDKLRAWLPHAEPVKLFLGDQHTDRHGRLLAHVIRASDGLAVAQMLVKSGLAVQSAVAPTTRCALSFVKLENQAIAANLGLWTVRDLMSVSATKMKPDDHGFKLISGTVTNVKSRQRFTNIILDNQLQIKVRPTLARTLSLQTLVGQSVEVRGWLSHKKNGPFLWLQHEANLSILEH